MRSHPIERLSIASTVKVRGQHGFRLQFSSPDFQNGGSSQKDLLVSYKKLYVKFIKKFPILQMCLKSRTIDPKKKKFHSYWLFPCHGQRLTACQGFESAEFEGALEANQWSRRIQNLASCVLCALRSALESKLGQLQSLLSHGRRIDLSVIQKIIIACFGFACSAPVFSVYLESGRPPAHLDGNSVASSCDDCFEASHSFLPYS